MLLRDLQEVTELDSQIIDLQNELVNLYRKRAAVVNEEAASPTTMANVAPLEWVEAQYARLTDIWVRFGVSIPTYKSLKPRLTKAEKVMDQLAKADARLAGNLEVLLVPPTTLFDLSAMRNLQPFIKRADFMSPEVKVNVSTSWKVMVAYAAPEGLDMGNAQNILATKTYKIGGHDTRALGVTEYLALTIQSKLPLDAMGWTLLLKDVKELVPSATFLGGQYRIDVDSLEGMVGDDGFRPAVGIKAGK